MLELRNIKFFYDASVLAGLDLEISHGAVHGIVGLNGAGKTTLLNIIAGLLKPDSGTLAFNQKPLEPNHVALLEAQQYFYPRITGREYISIFQISNPNFDVGGWNKLFELPLDELIETYSTGMKKKLGLLGVLCLDRPILLLDEPFNGLDLEASQTLKLVLEELKQFGKTVVLTSHILETLAATCDQISHLHSGRIAKQWHSNDFDAIESDLFHSVSAQKQEAIVRLLRGY